MIWPFTELHELRRKLDRSEETVGRLLDIIAELDPDYWTRQSFYRKSINRTTDA